MPLDNKKENVKVAAPTTNQLLCLIDTPTAKIQRGPKDLATQTLLGYSSASDRSSSRQGETRESLFQRAIAVTISSIPPGENPKEKINEIIRSPLLLLQRGRRTGEGRGTFGGGSQGCALGTMVFQLVVRPAGGCTEGDGDSKSHLKVSNHYESNFTRIYRCILHSKKFISRYF